MYACCEGISSVGKRVKRMMVNSGYKVEDLAFELDISSAHLRKLLNDQFKWKRVYIDKVVFLFNVSYEYVVYGEDYIEESDKKKELFDERLKQDLEHILQLDQEEQLKHWAYIFETASKSLKNSYLMEKNKILK